MVCEIGSEFWIDDISVEINKTKKPKFLKKWENLELTLSGRDALSLFLDNISENQPKSVLLPDYLCSSIIKPFKDNGYDFHFYEIDMELKPNIKEIEKKLINNKVGIFFHMGYFGFQSNKKLVELENLLKSKNIIIVEDVTHTLFSENVTLDSDYYLASIRKWLGVLSGGLLASPKHKFSNCNNEYNAFIDLRKEGLLLKYQYISNQDAIDKKVFLNIFAEAENILDKKRDVSGIDGLSKNIILNEDYKKNKFKRQENYQFLLDGLENISDINIIFDNLTNECPLFCAIILKNERVRNSLKNELIRHNIYCPIHWSRPKEVAANKEVGTNNIYDKILSIPCDQRYSNSDMSYIVDNIHNFFNSNNMEEK